MTTTLPSRARKHQAATRRAVRQWLTWPSLVVAAAVGTWIVLILRQLPCRTPLAGPGPDVFALMCYSDVQPLYSGRGLMAGNTPYFDSGDYTVLEYPVLTGLLLEIERLITSIIAPQGPGLNGTEQALSTRAFFDVNAVVMFGFFLLLVLAHLRISRQRPADVLMVAAAPVVMLTGLINWDMPAVALTSLAIWAWARQRPVLAGVLIGLATAAKLYPVLLLGPLLLLCLRANRMGAYAKTLGAAVLSWVLVNAPVFLFARDAWMAFWSFHSDRGADLGSIWYALSLAGVDVPHISRWSLVLLLIGCGLIGLLIMLAPRRPRLGQVAFLVVIVFVVTGQVYSPQYVLWLLPLLVLARPRWGEWVVFTVAEMIYFGAIWLHLAGQLQPGDGTPSLYILAIAIRVIVQLALSAIVVRDILDPRLDVLRGPGEDDQVGGVLDHAPDAGWFTRLPTSRSA
ncbi:glycosyltransferase family 87 protein [Enemella sp. A6]|uniref:glycosyltransferase family 87 protein n=1 Tax=Enemella sp. A6 TaxID=3440152 RepID=UPI003EBDD94D